MVSSPRRMGSLILRRSYSSDDSSSLPLHVDASVQSPLSCGSSSSSHSSSNSNSSSASDSDSDNLSLPLSSPIPPAPPVSAPLLHHSTHSSGSLTRRAHRRPIPTTWDENQRSLSSSRTGFTKVSRRSSNSSRTTSGNTLGVFLLGGLFFCGIWAGCYFLVTSYLASHDAALKQTVRQTEIVPMTRDMERKVYNLEQENKVLQDRLIGVEHERQQAAAEDPRLIQEIHSLNKQSTTYRESIQKLSQYAMQERFGAGPHYVEMEIAFDPESDTQLENESNNKIVLELAKANEMPHSVFWFLEQVTRGLFDGTSFHRSAAHVIQGGPASNFMSIPGSNPYQRFQRSGFEKVLMQEYNENWTHQPYTIGYAGRPGGPDFYFNMMDNSRHHGPKSDGKKSLEDVEPCFGKVIAGFDLVDRIHASDVQPGQYHALKHNVAIVKMRLMKPDEPALQQLQQQPQRPAATAQA